MLVRMELEGARDVAHMPAWSEAVVYLSVIKVITSVDCGRWSVEPVNKVAKVVIH
jgi:hypothetical protein